MIGGRYGLGSKEFTPAMAKAALDELNEPSPRRRFTVGIVDDVSGSSLPVDRTSAPTMPTTSAVFYALGSDGTVGANKSSVSIIGEQSRDARPGLLRLRLEEVGLDDRVPPAVRAGRRSVRPT